MGFYEEEIMTHTFLQMW